MMNDKAATEIKERKNELGYSTTPIVVIDLLWNTIFVTVIIVMVTLGRDEEPTLPLRAWLVGYGALCITHMVCVVFEYSNRRRGIRSSGLNSSSSSVRVDEDSGDISALDGVNRCLSCIWWIFGFFWVFALLCVGGLTITHETPKLFWLSFTFVVIDVFTVVFCTAVHCITCKPVFFCLPWAIATICVGISGMAKKRVVGT